MPTMIALNMAKKSDSELISLIREYSNEISTQSRFLKTRLSFNFDKNPPTDLEKRSILIALRNIRAAANQGVTAMEQMLTR